MQDNPLRAISASWLKLLKQAKDHKKPFNDDAWEAMQFFCGDPNFMWENSYARGERGYNKGIEAPPFRMQVNRVWEAVRLFAAVIHHRNPTRTVVARKYPSVEPMMLGIVPQQPQPMMGPQGPVIGPDGQPVMLPDQGMMAYQQMLQQQEFFLKKREVVSKLLEDYLNYTPVELNTKTHSRKVVEEAFIKGVGVWWHEMYAPEGSSVQMAGSFYDTFDNLVWDPDADDYQDIRWAARRRCQPVDEVAAKFGLSRDQLKGHLESYASRANEGDRGHEFKKKTGKTNDLIVYWEIYSKTGFGDRLKGAEINEKLKGSFDSVGKNCYIVVAEGVDFPLNIPPSMMDEPMEEPLDDGLAGLGGTPQQTVVPEKLFMAAQWPVPFWIEPQGWPFTLYPLHWKPGYSYPISMIRPGIGELRFINWAMSCLATKISISSKTLIGVAKAADPELKDKILSTSENGFNVVEISEAIGRNVNDVISVFQMPQVTQDMWHIIAEVTAMFDRRVGLTELVYGMTRNQFRSAAEANVKAEQISVRPDDYANILEDSLSECARKEALLARWFVRPEDIAPLMGPMAAQAWQMHVRNQDPEQIVREYDYRIEAGSARKPNIATRVENINNAMQILMPVAQGMLQAGQPNLFNSLITDWGKALQVDVTKYMIDPPPPPPPPPPPGPPPGPPPQEGPPNG